MVEPICKGFGLYCTGCLETLEIPQECFREPEKRIIYLDLVDHLHRDCEKFGDLAAARRHIRNRKSEMLKTEGWKRGLNLPRFASKANTQSVPGR